MASGQPTLKLTGGALVRLEAMTPPGCEAVVHLSLTDEPPYAQAFVVIEARAARPPPPPCRRGLGGYRGLRFPRTRRRMSSPDTPRAPTRRSPTAMRSGRRRARPPKASTSSRPSSTRCSSRSCLRIVLFQPFTIPSASMEPTLYKGDYIIVSKFAYGWSRNSVPSAPPPCRPAASWAARRTGATWWCSSCRATGTSTTSSAWSACPATRCR